MNIKGGAQATTDWGSQDGAGEKRSVDRANLSDERDLTRETKRTHSHPNA